MDGCKMIATVPRAVLWNDCGFPLNPITDLRELSQRTHEPPAQQLPGLHIADKHRSSQTIPTGSWAETAGHTFDVQLITNFIIENGQFLLALNDLDGILVVRPSGTGSQGLYNLAKTVLSNMEPDTRTAAVLKNLAGLIESQKALWDCLTQKHWEKIVALGQGRLWNGEPPLPQPETADREEQVATLVQKVEQLATEVHHLREQHLQQLQEQRQQSQQEVQQLLQRQEQRLQEQLQQQQQQMQEQVHQQQVQLQEQSQQQQQQLQEQNQQQLQLQQQLQQQQQQLQERNQQQFEHATQRLEAELTAAHVRHDEQIAAVTGQIAGLPLRVVDIDFALRLATQHEHVFGHNGTPAWKEVEGCFVTHTPLWRGKGIIIVQGHVRPASTAGGIVGTKRVGMTFGVKCGDEEMPEAMQYKNCHQVMKLPKAGPEKTWSSFTVIKEVDVLAGEDVRISLIACMSHVQTANKPVQVLINGVGFRVQLWRTA